MSHKLVSIIIPVYNVEAYLNECIASVLNQTYTEMEIILVDDGSTDKSGNMCEDFAEKDSRIIVIHKENGGLSDARNCALKLCKGKYVYFLDSDDVINKDAISLLVSNCEKSNADIAITGLKKFVHAIPEEKIYEEMGENITARETVRRMLLHRGIGHEACGKLYKKELWDGIEFPLGKLYEDYATVYKIIARAKSTVILSQPSYYYRTREGSIMNVKIKEKELQILDIADETTAYIATVFPEISYEAEYLQIVTYMKTLKRIMDGGFRQYIECQERIIKYVKEHKMIMKKEWVKKVDKIKYWSLMCGKGIFYFVYSIGEKK